MGQGGVGAVEQAQEVEVHHPAPLLGRSAFDRPQEHHPGVVHHGVEPPQLGHRQIDHPTDLVLVGDVGLVDLHLHLTPDPRGQVLQAVPAPGGEGQRRPLGRQGERRRLPDAA